MAVHHRHRNNQVLQLLSFYRAILILYFRVSLRLLLLKITRQPLVSPPIPERDFDPAVLPPSSTTSSPTLVSASPQPSPPVTPDHLRNNLVPLPPHPLLNSSQNTSAEEYLLPKSLTTSSVKPSLSLIRNLSSSQDWSAELIYILRPLVYGMPAVHSQMDPRMIFLRYSFLTSLTSQFARAYESSPSGGITDGMHFSSSSPHSPSTCYFGTIRVCTER